jgi:hypothetical protein
MKGTIMKKSLMCLCVLVMCSVVWAEDKKEAEPQKEKPDYRSVIVDAWLVRVDADALYKSGVKPLSEKDKENVSVMNLLWCLSDPNAGEVITSARTRACLAAKVQNTFENTKYYGETSETEVQGGRKLQSRINHAYSQKVEFQTCSFISEKYLKIRWDFYSVVIGENIKSLPPETITINYRDNATNIKEIGKPMIVGETQIGGDMFFLVMKAEIVE